MQGKRRGIAFTYGMQITAPLKLNPVVVCSIFSNLLKNAVAGATDALEDSQKAYIDVKSQADDAYLHVMVQNSNSTKKVKKIDIRKQSELCSNRIDTANNE